jgi:hypothetical protein
MSSFIYSLSLHIVIALLKYRQKYYLERAGAFRVKKITYKHLINFVADHKAPSIHVRKSRVRRLRQFFYFLTLHHLSMGLKNLIIIMLLITTKKGFDERITI